MFNLYLFNEPLYIITVPFSAVHIILDACYTTETPEVNRAYVIGQDAEGNPVYGTALNQAEVDLVGERLDFHQQLSIPTGSEAASVAQALLDKMRLTSAQGFILIPPNCGAELWDVIAVTDPLCAQASATYRIIAIRLDYHSAQSKYHHRLLLAAP